MKKFLSIAATAALSLVVFSACGDKDDEVEPAVLSVVSSDVTFTAKGGTGTIEVESTSDVSAVSDESWCSVSASGKTVNVTVSPSSGLYGRNAMVTITNAEKGSVRVPVSQSGMIWAVSAPQSCTFTNEGGTESFPFKSDYAYTVVSSDSWIGYSVDEQAGRMTITVGANSAGLRRGTVTIDSDKGEIVVAIVQFDIADIAGKYTATYMAYDPGTSNGYPLKDTTVTVTLTRSTAAATPNRFNARGFSGSSSITVPLDFNTATGSLQIAAGSRLGTYALSGTTYYAYLVLSSDVGYVHAATDYPYSAPVNVDDDGKIVLDFVDNVGFSFSTGTEELNAHLDGFMVWLFSADALNFNNSVGGLDSIAQLRMVKQ